MRTRSSRYLATLCSVFLLGASAVEAQEIELTFADHISTGLIEQDVFVERAPGAVYRVEPDELDRFRDAEIFTTTTPMHHAPFNPNVKGPYHKGDSLNMTLGAWLSGRGAATYSCSEGTGHLKVSFSKLVPDGVYTMWYAFLGQAHLGCPECPFGAIDLPFGEPDGSTAGFVTDGQGDAVYEASMSPCLPLSGTFIATMLAIAYHSDGKTFGVHPGKFGTQSHIHLFTLLPEAP